MINKAWQFPKFTTLEFFPKRNRYCICVFLLNEGQKIIDQLKEMEQFSKLIDIVVADGGSTDGSLKPGFLKKTGIRTLLVKTGRGQLSAQMRMAFSYALSQNYKGVVVIDGNHKDDVTAIPRFIEALDQGFDHVQGSRFIKGGKHLNTPFSRLLGVRLFHAPLVSLASSFWHTDTTNGFRAYSSKLLTDSRLAIFRNIFANYELHYYLSIKAAKMGFRVVEIPVTRKYPAGKISTKINSWKGNLAVVKTLLDVILGKYDLK